MNIEEPILDYIIFEYNNEPYGIIINIKINDHIYDGKHHCEIELNKIEETDVLEETQKKIVIQYSEYNEICEILIKLNFNKKII